MVSRTVGHYFELEGVEAIALAHSAPYYVKSGFAVLFRSDNSSAVALVNKESSTSKSLHAIGYEIIRVVTRLHVKVAAVHISGISNSVADTLSRLAEVLFARRVLTRAGRSWIARTLRQQGLTLLRCADIRVGAASQAVSVTETLKEAKQRIIRGASSATAEVICSVPPPSSYRSGILQASLISSQGLIAAVLLPLSPAHLQSHMWRHDLQHMQYRCVGGTVVGEVQFFAADVLDISAHAPHAPPFSLEISPALHLWAVSAERRIGTI